MWTTLKQNLGREPTEAEVCDLLPQSSSRLVAAVLLQVKSTVELSSWAITATSDAICKDLAEVTVGSDLSAPRISSKPESDITARAQQLAAESMVWQSEKEQNGRG